MDQNLRVGVGHMRQNPLGNSHSPGQRIDMLVN